MSGSSGAARFSGREGHLVELVEEDGTPAGSATVREAHEAPGQLHRAFSVFLRDDQGRVLLQQRAAAKTRFPLRWGNTCCGHPEPGEEVTVSAARRLAEELGVKGVRLLEVGIYAYFAEDPMTGRVEREYDHVLLGEVRAGMEFRPDPAEVARLRWTGLAELRERLEQDPESYAPWLVGVAGRLSSHLESVDSPPAVSLPPGVPPAGTPLSGPASSAGTPSSGPASSAGTPLSGSERSGGR